jgi:hypothetical protein
MKGISLIEVWITEKKGIRLIEVWITEKYTTSQFQ